MTGESPSIDRSRIRVKAFVLLSNPARTHHAVWRGDERSIDAARREMGEELGIELVEPRLLGTLENVYQFRGEEGHEVVFVYTGSTTTDVVPEGGGEFFDLGRPMWVEWRRLDGIGEGLPLYPDGV